MSRCDVDGHCITCSDEAIPMRVVELLPGGETALCVPLVSARPDTPGARGGPGASTEILIGLLDGLSPGAVVLVHAGAALVRVEESEYMEVDR